MNHLSALPHLTLILTDERVQDQKSKRPEVGLKISAYNQQLYMNSRRLFYWIKTDYDFIKAIID